MEIQYFTADAFTRERFHGAQIAVVPEADNLNSAQMQRIAAEFNLSETVFVQNGRNGSHRARIFSPHRELGFAGHPLVAMAHVLAESGRLSLRDGDTLLRVEQESGDIDISISSRNGKPDSVRFSMTVNPSIDRFVPSREELGRILTLQQSDLCAGDFASLMVACEQPYLVVPVRNLMALERARFNFDCWSESMAPSMLAREIALFCSGAHAKADFHIRLLGPDIGKDEDPPIGAFVPSFAAYLCAHDHIRIGTYPFTAERGNPQARLSLLDVEMDNKGEETLTVRVGGSAVTMSQGVLYC